jgi:hypothetical protein
MEMINEPRVYADLDPQNLPLRTLILRMPYQAYAAIDAVRATHLKAAAQSRAHYRQAVDNPKGDTPSLKLGRWAHEATFEPHLFAAVEEADLRLKSDQAARANAQGIRDAIQANATASDIIQAGWPYTESVVLWRDEQTGLLCKVRFDVAGHPMLHNDAPTGFVLDLKTTRDCLPDKFSRSAVDFGYHIQMAHYLAGADACGLTEAGHGKFWALAVESHPPYAMLLFDMGPWYEAGKVAAAMAMRNIKASQDTGLYPAYSEDPIVLEPPPWIDRGLVGDTLAAQMGKALVLQPGPESHDKGE